MTTGIEMLFEGAEERAVIGRAEMPVKMERRESGGGSGVTRGWSRIWKKQPLIDLTSRPTELQGMEQTQSGGPAATNQGNLKSAMDKLHQLNGNWAVMSYWKLCPLSQEEARRKSLPNSLLQIKSENHYCMQKIAATIHAAHQRAR